jgi:orotidine-5'-phosphate decarboxylase
MKRGKYMIIDRLIERIKATNNPTVVGLDPRLDYVPEETRRRAYAEHGETLAGAGAAIFEFNKYIIDEVYELVPAVKPQIAMYEQFGAPGVDCYIKTVAYARAKGLIVIGDVKRSDIASTAQAYSDGHIGRVAVGSQSLAALDTDFITINPYLGFDSVEPYLDNCHMYEKGLFVLVKTSNPNSGEIQDLTVTDGGAEELLYERVGKLVSRWGEGLIGKHGYSAIGAVVGATFPQQAAKLRELMPHTFFLVPGYGAQGGRAEDLAVCFDKNGLGAIVNSSRGIICAKSPRQAVIEMRDELNRWRQG